jgi:hypothetical protein
MSQNFVAYDVGGGRGRAMIDVFERSADRVFRLAGEFSDVIYYYV